MSDIEIIPKPPEDLQADFPVDMVGDAIKVYDDIMLRILDELMFDGKSLKEWATDLMVEVPRDMDGHQHRRILCELAHNWQRACNYYSVASSIEASVGGSVSIKQKDMVRLLNEHYRSIPGRSPAAKVIEQEAASYLKNTTTARIAAKIIKSFWRQRLDQMQQLHKMLEQIGISLHVESKVNRGP